MAQPWFDPNAFGAMAGAIIGGGGGIIGGILGAVTGKLVQTGKGKKGLYLAYSIFFSFGLILLCVGLYALIAGQPYGIWYPLLLSGVIFSFVMGLGRFYLLPQNYRMVEARKLAANEIRATSRF